MKKCVFAVIVAALAVCGFAGVSSAAAATEIGNTCAGEEIIPDSLISVSHGADVPLPVAAPISGVLTEWTVTSNLGSGGTPSEELFLSRLARQTLNVYRPAGGKSYTLVAEAEGGPLKLIGASTYLARIPVQAGDLLGLGAGFALYCQATEPADKIVYLEGQPALGSTTEFPNEEEEIGIPVKARIEPDVDGDGYGDETQDKCPQSAAYQTACPVVTISSLPTAGKKAVTLYISTSLSAPVGVTATVPLGKGKTATLTAAAQTVAPGTLAAFTLTLTPEVAKALKALPTKKSLTMSITASATNVTGSPSTSATTVKLPGQAKPKPKHHKNHKKSKGK
jgi:hypothetical protein